MACANDAVQGLGLGWFGMVFRGRNLKIVSTFSPETDRCSRKLSLQLTGGRDLRREHYAARVAAPPDVRAPAPWMRSPAAEG